MARDDMNRVIAPGVNDHLASKVVDGQPPSSLRGDGLVRLGRRLFMRGAALREGQGQGGRCQNCQLRTSIKKARSK
jgi:hypothetical protein